MRAALFRGGAAVIVVPGEMFLAPAPAGAHPMPARAVTPVMRPDSASLDCDVKSGERELERHEVVLFAANEPITVSGSRALFLGSGLLFVAMIFVLSSEVTNSLAAWTNATSVSSRLQLVLTLLTSYCARMAAVFTIATTTIGRGLGVFPRWLVALGYIVAVILLFINISWSVLIFPVWMLALSGFIFLAGSPHRQAAQAPIS